MKIKLYIRNLIKVEPNELSSVVGSFLFAFLLMSSYSMLKPVRDAMASDWTDATVSTLWTLTFLFSFVAVSIHGWVASRVRMTVFVPGIYAFFALTFILFYLAYRSLPAEMIDGLGQSYYVWVSVFALFHISVFWSFMTQMYTREQATRLFATIATGASAGAIFGPSITLAFAPLLGSANLILLATTVLLLSIPLVLFLTHAITKTHSPDDTDHHISNQALGGSFYAGFVEFITHRQLLGIGMFIFIFTGISTFVYFAQKNVLADFASAERAQILAGIELAVNIMTFVIGIFLTNRLVKRFGITCSLAIVPVLVVAGLLLVAGNPAVWMIVGLQFVRRVGNYAVTRPSREMLFTTVDPVARFKAKPVVDIICYRGGDVFWAWCFTFLTSGLGLGLNSVALTGAGIAAIWAVTGIYLGRQFERGKKGQGQVSDEDEKASETSKELLVSTSH